MNFDEITDLNIQIMTNRLGTVGNIEDAKNKNLIKFSKIYWFLSSLISNQGQFLNFMMEKDTRTKILLICIEWVLEDKNFQTLCESNVQMVLELFYQLFLDYQFLTSKETTKYFQLFWRKLKSNLINEKKKTNSNIMNSTLSPSMSHFSNMLSKPGETDNNDEDIDPNSLLPKYMS